MRTPRFTEFDILTASLVACVVSLLHNGRTVESFGYSYSRFIGPVRGPERQIIVRDRHDGTGRVDYVARPEYHFAYGVEDAKTRVLQNRRETRNGDDVKGVYSVVDPDGTLRVVKYTADNVNGFQAEVISNGVSRIHGQDYPTALHPPQDVAAVDSGNQGAIKDNHQHQVQVQHPAEKPNRQEDDGGRKIPVHEETDNNESSEAKDAGDYEDEDGDDGRPANRNETEEREESDEEVEDY